ncbi:HNH endonuclease signature motif containing protein [Streptomyces sp. NPDC058330]|uniref:HNH endonuclease signature motif containing protein n=1 Tax=Streptomyces sp. NPDC058330 TaxID=3346449 RepID=UPI0036E354B9
MPDRIPVPAVRRQLVLTEADVELFRSLCSEPDGRSLCSIPDDAGCVRWQGRTDKGGWGYAKVNSRRHAVPAHHVAWAIAFGDIPEDTGMEVDHLCQVRNCVSIVHLEWVTTLENQRRIDKRRPLCRRGHDWNGSLPFFRAGAWVRMCFVCIAEGPRKHTSRKKYSRSKEARMIICPRGHDVSGDNGYVIDGLPGRRGCWICTNAFRNAE